MCYPNPNPISLNEVIPSQEFLNDWQFDWNLLDEIFNRIETNLDEDQMEKWYDIFYEMNKKYEEEQLRIFLEIYPEEDYYEYEEEHIAIPEILYRQ